jgi:hypothetical protein
MTQWEVVLKKTEGKELNDLLGGFWADFEAWIRKTIGSDFIWSIRPFDSEQNREMVMEDICKELAKNDGIFPKKGPWIERYESER